MKQGYFSQTMADNWGAAIYTTPDGKNVIVTHVGTTPPGWEDTICVGPVDKFVSSTIKPLLTND